MSELVVFYRGQPILRESLSATLMIGSGPQCDIRLIDSVQSCHAKIETSPKGFLITEVEGQVFMGSKRILGSHFLRDGDLFDLGSYRFQILESSQAWMERREKDNTLTESKGSKDKKDSIPALYFLAPFKKKFQQIGILIGRSPACDIPLDNPYVSTRHAEIFVRDGKYFIRDLDSRNGVFVNDFRATETPLPATGTIRLGRLNLSYQIEIASEDDESIPGIEISGPALNKRMIVYKSQAFKSVINKLKTVAPSNDTILLLGETGVGKDVLGALIHQEHPKRKDQPFIIVNCATITSTIAESLLFGHVKGSFTGADSNHKGYFEQADRGTLFLDEVGELPPESQARLLRVLEDKVIRPVGSNRQIPVDVRVIAATNRDLEAAQRSGAFRQDLYERFDWIIKIPALRERSEDIEPLIRHFLSSLSPVPLSIKSQLISSLQKLPWSGNIRALQRSIRTAITNAISRGSSELWLDDFEFREQVVSPPQPHRSFETPQDRKDQFLAALVAHEGIVRKAVRELGISSKTAYEMIKKHDIDLGFLRKK